MRSDPTLQDLALALPGLTASPGAVVLALHRAGGRFLTTDQLMLAIDEATGNSYSTYSVPSSIKRARRILSKHGAGEIHCQYSIGWRLEWSPEWREKMSSQSDKPEVSGKVIRKGDHVLLVVETEGQSPSVLSMSPVIAIELAQKLIHSAKGV